MRRLIESILTAKRVEPNPATWARLRELLSKKIAEVKPRAAMAAKDLPAFMTTLGDDVESRALKFVILTGVPAGRASADRIAEDAGKVQNVSRPQNEPIETERRS